MQILKDNWDQSFSQYGELLEAISIAYYGTPPRTAVDFDTGSTYPTGLKPRHIAGFTRAHQP